jgi:hypothetical protein
MCITRRADVNRCPSNGNTRSDRSLRPGEPMSTCEHGTPVDEDCPKCRRLVTQMVSRKRRLRWIAWHALALGVGFVAGWVAHP